MEVSMRMFSTLFVTLLLLLATGIMGPIAMVSLVNARTCETLSNTFHGICLSDRNCESVCDTEGFTGGDCRGFRRRCFCTRQC
ncbi:defensin-like protein 1 [Argentina anserina]|uniref:defensin-like protein 1 n=1 Tax=Argentina anserina TaxID=57926 RepID=UPI00217675BC|nr:defensin-like protein 1 [Potentilla anserina]